MSDPKIIRVGPKGGGLYNTLLGDGHEMERGRLAAFILNVEFGRFRDAWVELDERGEPRWAIYTRNGGGNRADYVEQIEAMRTNPHFISDRDDDFDSTYATFYFRLPVEVPPDAEMRDFYQNLWDQSREYLISEAMEKPVNMSEIWKQALDRMNTDPEFAKEQAERSGIGQAMRDLLGE